MKIHPSVDMSMSPPEDLKMPWNCWCGARYSRGYNGHYATKHREWHKYHEDGDYNRDGSLHRETRSWTTIRYLILNRDDRHCRICGNEAEYNTKGKIHVNEHGTWDATWERINLEVHHIIPRCKGGTDHPYNLITLCEKCHNHTKSNGYGGLPGAVAEGGTTIDMWITSGADAS